MHSPIRLDVDAAQVKHAVATLLSDPGDTPKEALVAARALDALPFWMDIGGCLLLKATGEVVTFGWDEPQKVEPVLDNERDLLALHGARGSAARKYSEIRGLMPLRDAAARTCPGCKGTGRLANVPASVVCVCGGLGWLPGRRAT